MGKGGHGGKDSGKDSRGKRGSVDTNRADQGMCSVHMKPRGLQNLDDNGDGTMRCKPGMECNTGPGYSQDSGGDLIRCNAHGKMRTRSALNDNGDGTFVCQPGKECRGGSNNAAVALAAMQARSPITVPPPPPGQPY